VSELGFSINPGNVRYIRYDLTGAEFSADPVLTISGASTTVASRQSNYVIFEVTAAAAPASALGQTTSVTLAATSLQVKSTGTVGVQYRLYETATAAVAGNSAALATKSGTLAKFAPALEAKFVPATPAKIDVSSESKLFTSGNSTIVGNIAYGANTNYLWSDGNAVSLAKLVAAGTKIEISADLSAGLKDASDSTKLDPSALTIGTIKASSITGTKATFTVDASAGGDVTSNPVVFTPVTYTVDGTTPISATSFDAQYLVTAATDSTASDLTFGTLSTLSKNGSSASVDLTMKPGGFYNDVVRITNKSGVAGEVFITVINDAGKSATVNLADIAGQTSNVLAAGASTQQLQISDIFAAAEAKGLALEGQGKLRLVVEAQIPQGNLSVQNWVVSTDGTTLSSF
jgi:hypothetical protein